MSMCVHMCMCVHVCMCVYAPSPWAHSNPVNHASLKFVYCHSDSGYKRSQVRTYMRTFTHSYTCTYSYAYAHIRNSIPDVHTHSHTYIGQCLHTFATYTGVLYMRAPANWKMCSNLTIMCARLLFHTFIVSCDTHTVIHLHTVFISKHSFVYVCVLHAHIHRFSCATHILIRSYIHTFRHSFISMHSFIHNFSFISIHTFIDFRVPHFDTFTYSHIHTCIHFDAFIHS